MNVRPGLDVTEKAARTSRRPCAPYLKKVLLAELRARWQFHQDDLGRIVHVLRDPQRHDVVRRRPQELAHAVNLRVGRHRSAGCTIRVRTRRGNIAPTQVETGVPVHNITGKGTTLMDDRLSFLSLRSFIVEDS